MLKTGHVASGLLNIYKPSDIQSFDIIYRLKKEFGIRKSGYTGTLDNFASGLLLIGIGQGTKLIKHLLEMDKEYKAVIIFGKTSDTLDRKGVFTEEKSVVLDKEKLETVLKSFVRTYDQMPPQFSSKKINGRRASDLVREGKEVVLKPVPITIYEIKLISFEESGRVEISVRCSTGTYIRSLARDIALELGTVAYLDSLERVSNGPFKVADSIPLEKLNVERDVLSLRDALPHVPEHELKESSLSKFTNGSPVYDDDFVLAPSVKGVIKIVYLDQLLAIVQRGDEGSYRYMDNFKAGL